MSKNHSFKNISIWLFTIIITMTVTTIFTQAAMQPKEIIQVEYIVVTQSEYENKFKPVERPYRVETLTVTAYAPLDNQSGICADEDPTNTATGTYPAVGTVAVNPDKFPYGTEFYIPGYGEGKALDTGSALREDPNKIDVVMNTYEEAKEWGVQVLEVVVYED